MAAAGDVLAYSANVKRKRAWRRSGSRLEDHRTLQEVLKSPSSHHGLKFRNGGEGPVQGHGQCRGLPND